MKWFLVVAAVCAALFIFAQVEGATVPFLPPRVSVTFVGDIMLDRGVAAHTVRYGTSTILGNFIFPESDLLVGNLEGTITRQKSVATPSNLRFTFDPALAQDILKPFSLVTLANNHTGDFGQIGLDETRTSLDSFGVGYFGSPTNSSLEKEVEIKGRQICFIGYEAFINAGTDSVVQKIQSLRTHCYKIIVFAHWGQEYEPHPTGKQFEAGHAFIDAGADLVVGAHPHVVEDYEVYHGHAIFYSLGNFIFDQDFSPETTSGLMLKVDFVGAQSHFSLYPVTLSHGEALGDGLVAERFSL